MYLYTCIPIVHMTYDTYIIICIPNKYVYIYIYFGGLNNPTFYISFWISTIQELKPSEHSCPSLVPFQLLSPFRFEALIKAKQILRHHPTFSPWILKKAMHSLKHFSVSTSIRWTAHNSSSFGVKKTNKPVVSLISFSLDESFSTCRIIFFEANGLILQVILNRYILGENLLVQFVHQLIDIRFHPNG